MCLGPFWKVTLKIESKDKSRNVDFPRRLLEKEGAPAAVLEAEHETFRMGLSAAPLLHERFLGNDIFELTVIKQRRLRL
ncbi:hypothetical protein ACLOJK_016607 [Asimina triloba]